MMEPVLVREGKTDSEYACMTSKAKMQSSRVERMVYVLCYSIGRDGSYAALE